MVPLFSYIFLSTFGCVAKFQFIVHLASMIALLTVIEGVAPASVLAVKVSFPFRSHESILPSRFIETVYFSSKAIVRGDVGAAGAGAAAENPRISVCFEFLLVVPNRFKFSSFPIADKKSFFFFPPPMPPRVRPFFGTKRTGSSTGSVGFSNEGVEKAVIPDPAADELCSYPGVTPPPPIPTIPPAGAVGPLPIRLFFKFSICLFLICSAFSSMAFLASIFLASSIMIAIFSS
mmetsp:Transcript_10956/g.16568  ORF Transcript_10956/g.16568 Transcript_10956/m.16568 type:complete len:233 (-) Transcript_10956:556-1254(-)